MYLYNIYVGEWNYLYDNIKWQKLPGGDHSAIGDCKATLELLRKIANSDLKKPPSTIKQYLKLISTILNGN